MSMSRRLQFMQRFHDLIEQEFLVPEINLPVRASQVSLRGYNYWLCSEGPDFKSRR
jgi:hypothetical protein